MNRHEINGLRQRRSDRPAASELQVQSLYCTGDLGITPSAIDPSVRDSPCSFETTIAKVAP
jgi:hypothetical protein